MANQYDTNLKLQAIADAIGDTGSSGLISALEDIADAVAGGGGGGSSAAGLVSDNFSDTDTYDLGDYCIHNNTLYVCINAINTPGPWDLSDWQATNTGIQLASLNSNLSKNAFGTAIVVVASTTSLPANQWYEIPADGYIIISALGEQARKAWVSGSIYGPSKTGAHFNWEVYCPLESNISVVETPVYVKKGMWFFIGGIIGKASVSFIPLA